jgi:MerR family transcriptional regulator, copper efflux regulator
MGARKIMDNSVSLLQQEEGLIPSTPVIAQGDFDFLFIGELAERFGLNPKTIRFYEKAGLLEPARHGKFRTYLKEDARKLKFILKLRALGVSIAKIKSLSAEKQNASELTKSILSSHVEDLRQKKIMIEQQLNDTANILEAIGSSNVTIDTHLNA